jgi:hypothetical protein
MSDAPLWTAVVPQPKPRPQLAPAGTVWVCGACGKTSPDWIYGPRGWDESCALNSVLCRSSTTGEQHV